MRRIVSWPEWRGPGGSGGLRREPTRRAGPNVSASIQVGGFDQLEVAGPYDVEVRTGGAPSVSAQRARSS